MRTCQRNKRPIYYALFTGQADVIDADGFYTGEKSLTYGTPTKAKMNVSGGRGVAEIELFGIDNPFTRTAVTDDLETNFNTDTIFWFGIEPGDTATAIPHNYRCTGVSRTINQVVIALAEIDRGHEDVVSA